MFNGLDVSFFDEPQMLAVIPPLRLIGVGLALRTTVLPSLEERIDEIAGRRSSRLRLSARRLDPRSLATPPHFQLPFWGRNKWRIAIDLLGHRRLVS
ncbi:MULTISPECIES: hypothetical protein [unclassified Pseudomonas]|uniref:hypothetical protein n=1 Tax=unclassified Pseudomonas TaxID=196821 RepID=UPI001C4507CC|nr:MULTISPECIES: hypothetical protein [unclassified Pseudomonas]